MIVALAFLIAFALVLIGVLHALWAAGITWPLKSEKELVRTVAGFPDMEEIPPLTSGIVAVLLFAAGLWAVAMTRGMSNHALTFGGIALAAVFIFRGGLGYTGWWRAKTSDEPFSRLDKILYSPISLALGAGFAILVVARIF